MTRLPKSRPPLPPSSDAPPPPPPVQILEDPPADKVSGRDMGNAIALLIGLSGVIALSVTPGFFGIETVEEQLVHAVLLVTLVLCFKG